MRASTSVSHTYGSVSINLTSNQTIGTCRVRCTFFCDLSATARILEPSIAATQAGCESAFCKWLAADARRRWVGTGGPVAQLIGAVASMQPAKTSLQPHWTGSGS